MLHVGACIIVLLIRLGVIGQNSKVVHKVLGKDDGVELDIINDLVFDTDGFLWLGGRATYFVQIETNGGILTKQLIKE